MATELVVTVPNRKVLEGVELEGEIRRQPDLVRGEGFVDGVYIVEDTTLNTINLNRLKKRLLKQKNGNLFIRVRTV